MTPFELMQRLVGEVIELPGAQQHPAIQWGHMLSGLTSETPDEVAWCSSLANWVCWLLRLPRSKSAMARSWLNVGMPIPLEDARPGYDVVVLERGSAPSGHVGFFAGLEGPFVHILGGNQSNGVTVAAFDKAHVLGVRRLRDAA